MDCNMKSLSETRLNNNSILKKMCTGIKFNWVFIPGGPGLGSEYLIDLLTGPMKLEGNVYILTLPKYCEKINDRNFLINLEEDINQILIELENVILVGHSFGGMLLQSINLHNNQYDKVILLCSSPSLDCFKIAEKSYNDFNEYEKDSIFQSQESYFKNKNNINFKSLFKSWAPYYTSRNDFNSYLKMINECSFDFRLYEWGNRFFNNFFASNQRIPKKTIVISAEYDKICPPSLFNDYVEQLEDFNILPTSLHFPWIKNSDLLMEVFKKIEKGLA